MVDLHDEGPSADAPAGTAPRQRSATRGANRRTRVGAGARAAGDEDLSGGIPRPSRPVVTTVERDHGVAGADPPVPEWVNDGSARTTRPEPAPPSVPPADVPEAAPEPLVIVPAVQPDEAVDEAGTTASGSAQTAGPVRPARRQLQVPRRARVRRVTRVIRYVDPWGVFKVALVFHLVGYATVLVAGVLLWNVAHATGTVDNVERFMESFGWERFEFHGGAIFHHAWIIGLFAVVGLTGLAVLTAATFNLVTDLVGGLRVTVLEEELVAVPARPWLRSSPARSEPEPSRLAEETAPFEPAPVEADVDPWSSESNGTG